MKTQEILSIVALGLLGVCLLCGLAKMAMKNPKSKQACNHACSLSFFVAVVLLGVSQLIEEEGYKSGMTPDQFCQSKNGPDSYCMSDPSKTPPYFCHGTDSKGGAVVCEAPAPAPLPPGIYPTLKKCCKNCQTSGGSTSSFYACCKPNSDGDNYQCVESINSEQSCGEKGGKCCGEESGFCKY